MTSASSADPLRRITGVLAVVAHPDALTAARAAGLPVLARGLP